MTADYEARARELARSLYDAQERHECRGPCQGPAGNCITLGYCPQDVDMIVPHFLSAIQAAEDRGMIAGLKEARKIAGTGNFKTKPETVADGVLFHVRGVLAAIDTRLAALAPPAETAKETEG